MSKCQPDESKHRLRRRRRRRTDLSRVPSFNLSPSLYFYNTTLLFHVVSLLSGLTLGCLLKLATAFVWLIAFRERSPECVQLSNGIPLRSATRRHRRTAQRVFLKTSRVFGKTGNRHAFFRLPARPVGNELLIRQRDVVGGSLIFGTRAEQDGWRSAVCRRHVASYGRGPARREHTHSVFAWRTARF